MSEQTNPIIKLDTSALHTALVELESMTVSNLRYCIRHIYEQQHADVCYLFLAPDEHQVLSIPVYLGRSHVSPDNFRWNYMFNEVTGTIIHVTPLPGLPPRNVVFGWFTPSEEVHHE